LDYFQSSRQDQLGLSSIARDAADDVLLPLLSAVAGHHGPLEGRRLETPEAVALYHRTRSMPGSAKRSGVSRTPAPGYRGGRRLGCLDHW
jgi:hypothetical protein